MSSLYDILEAEYCPPLDSSLLAALIADVEPTPGSDARAPSTDQVAALRATLKELACHASEQHEYELCRELDTAHLSPTDGSCSSPDRYGYWYGYGDMSESLTSDSSAHCDQAFSSPLGFLQVALPHIPPWKLRRALNDAGCADAGDVDMESVVEKLLTDEYIRELEERGLDGLDDDEAPDTIEEWHRVGTWEKSLSLSQSGKPSGKKIKNARRKTITLGDTRQKQQAPPPPANKSLPGPAPDLWTLVSSVSEHLTCLLPPHPTTFFQSYFHRPDHPSPAHAVRAALSDIAGKQTPTSSADTGDTLITLLDIIQDSHAYATLDSVQRSTVYSDAQLALRATQGLGDDAIDIVWLLLDLELDLHSRRLAMGVYHAAPSPSPFLGLSSARGSSPLASPTAPPRSFTRPANAAAAPLPGGPSSPQPPPTAKRKLSLPTSTSTSPQTSGAGVGEWQVVGKRGKGDVDRFLHSHAYTHGPGHGHDMRRCVAESWRRQNELLRDMTRAWRGGNSRTRGGEVAQCLAERAREMREAAKRTALDEARRMVEYKRPDPHTLDLHGTSVAEAIVIVKEILECEGCSPSKPLRIITGRGTHSANGVGVLKPAVRNALVRDGWNVSVWHGGLVVRGQT